MTEHYVEKFSCDADITTMVYRGPFVAIHSFDFVPDAEKHTEDTQYFTKGGALEVGGLELEIIYSEAVGGKKVNVVMTFRTAAIDEPSWEKEIASLARELAEAIQNCEETWEPGETVMQKLFGTQTRYWTTFSIIGLFVVLLFFHFQTRKVKR